MALVTTVSDWKPDISEIGIVLYAVSIFVLAIKNPDVSLGKIMEILGKRYSVYIYIIHLAVNGIVGYLPVRFMVLTSEWYRPISILIISLILSVAFYKIDKKWRSRNRRTSMR